MEYNTLKNSVDRAMADLHYKLSYCNDPYRLNHLLKNYIRVMEQLRYMADDMVCDLERGNDG